MGGRATLSRTVAARAVGVFGRRAPTLRRVQGHARASHGFKEESAEDLPDLGARARLFVHDSGARLLSLSAPRDVNKTFAIAFRTASEDSTGVAHILEHSVLCGSARYPVREPFVDMLRGSLQTALNAMTYPDRTVYPVSSPNRQDFYNLASVYLDAVLAPRLEEATFRQEGWHWALHDADGPLKRQGVVLSEMRGVYSSPDATHYREFRRRLFPDMVYHHDSGGDPACIPDLTYRAFLDFHRERYHPSNALIIMHGDDPEEERLRFLASRLAPFTADGPHPPADLNTVHGLRTQPQWSAPQRAVAPSPASAGSGESHHSALHWVAGFDPAEELEASLARDVLAYCLMGTHAAPLRWVSRRCRPTPARAPLTPCPCPADARCWTRGSARRSPAASPPPSCSPPSLWASREWRAATWTLCPTWPWTPLTGWPGKASARATWRPPCTPSSSRCAS